MNKILLSLFLSMTSSIRLASTGLESQMEGIGFDVSKKYGQLEKRDTDCEWATQVMCAGDSGDVLAHLTGLPASDFTDAKNQCLSFCNGIAGAGCCYALFIGSSMVNCYAYGISTQISGPGYDSTIYASRLLSCSSTPDGGAEDDPHLTSLNGKKFNIHVEGVVPLLSLGNQTDPFLQVKGLVERLDSDPSLCGGLGYYFTGIDLSGSILNHKEIKIRKDRNLNEFIMDLNGHETRIAEQKKQDIVIDQHGPNPFTIKIYNSVNNATSQKGRSVQINLKNNVMLRIEAQTIGLTQKETSGFLNFYMHGVKKYAKEARGILGNDDASQWINSHANDACIEKTAVGLFTRHSLSGAHKAAKKRSSGSTISVLD